MVINLQLGKFEKEVFKAIEQMAKSELVERIWRHDHTLWQPDPTEIANRLGWLTIAEKMQAELEDLEKFATDLFQMGYRRAILLGMGGSSLAPEVFRETFGVAAGRLDLEVLDSTAPSHILEIRDTLNYEETLFIVATKSGSTVETLSFLKYFFNQVQAKVGRDKAGQHFIAITDPGSNLAELAHRLNFRKTFENDPNIGGRYSALSYFGLVPAALVGVNLKKLLASAVTAAKGCAADMPYLDNNAVLLGAAIAVLAKQGRDKLTFVLSPGIAHFGDWVEQLLAESTGKSGTGILPVIGEPLGPAPVYSGDRVFVQLQITGAQVPGNHLANLVQAGHPVLSLELQDQYELGGQMFIWEMATAIAGAHMGIHPFNQPNVESAKERAKHLVVMFKDSGSLPPEEPSWQDHDMAAYWGLPAETASTKFHGLKQAISRLVANAQEGAYFGLHAYLPPRPDLADGLQRIQEALRDKTGAAVTLGFGPRFLHSTGQLHKGDGGRGLFLQFTGSTKAEVAIPDDPGAEATSLDFGVLIRAQAKGDRQALVEADRKVLRIDLGSDFQGGLQRVLTVIKQMQRVG